MRNRKAALAALLGIAFAGTVSAAELQQGINGPELVAILQDAGYKAKLETDDEGDPLVRTGMSGVNVVIFFYDCKAHRCGSLQFSVGLDLEDGTKTAILNRFNRNYRYVRAYLDDENDPYLKFDFEVLNTAHADYIVSQIDIWEDLLGEFFKATGFDADAAAPAAPAGHVLGLRRDVTVQAVADASLAGG